MCSTGTWNTYSNSNSSRCIEQKNSINQTPHCPEPSVILSVYKIPQNYYRIFSGLEKCLRAWQEAASLTVISLVPHMAVVRCRQLADVQCLHKLLQNCRHREGLKEVETNWEINGNERIPKISDRFFFSSGEIMDYCLRGCRISYGKELHKTLSKFYLPFQLYQLI